MPDPNDDIESNRLKEQRELFEFLADESRKNREALRSESDSVQEMFIRLSKIVAIPLSIVLVIAGLLGYKSFSDMRDAIQRQAKAEGQQAIATATKELQKQVKEQVSAQFQTPVIKQTIFEAATESTKSEAQPLIVAGVKSEVDSAVERQSGLIKQISTNAVNDMVRATITPLESQLNTQVLIARVNAEDAEAYDDLLRIKDSRSTELRKQIKTVIEGRPIYERDSLYHGRSSGCGLGETTAPTSQLRSPDMAQRKQLIADCSAWIGHEFDDSFAGDGTRLYPFQIELEIVPKIFHAALEDPSLSVRAQAVDLINQMFVYPLADSPLPTKPFDLLNLDDLRAWWNANNSNYRALTLVSAASNRSYDSIDLYDELGKAENAPSIAGRKQLEAARSRMRFLATQAQQPISIQGAVEQICTSTVASVFSNDRFGMRPIVDTTDEWFRHLKMLSSCPANHRMVPSLFLLAETTQLLSRRYAAIVIINKWEGQQFDPSDPKPVEEWLNKRSPVSLH